MIKEDFVIQSNVRQILVRSDIDYSKIDFGTVRGVVYFRGFFQLRPIFISRDDELAWGIRNPELSKKALYSLEKKVKAIPGVKDVIFQFLNWGKEKGVWNPVELEKKEGKNDGKKNSSV